MSTTSPFKRQFYWDLAGFYEDYRTKYGKSRNFRFYIVAYRFIGLPERSTSCLTEISYM